MVSDLATDWANEGYEITSRSMPRQPGFRTGCLRRRYKRRTHECALLKNSTVLRSPSSNDTFGS
jgi:hypothetical protein